jgi:murein L,D-transpeptidase YcbB/YkuD
MTTLATSTDSDKALQAYNPQHKGYLALRAKLSEWRESTASLADVQSGRKGEAAPHYPLDTAEFLANMERWRWLPADAGASRIEVNIPEYTLRLYENGALKHTGRVVVGKTNTQTPVFSSVMDHLVINPSWGVPASILKHEFLPKLAADPDYAERHGYQVIRNKDERIIGIRQPPGERNALGFIKFMFPNEHAVYLHDTPQRNLFARDDRAFSHGCVRVDQPFALANVLLSTMGYDEAKLKALIGKGEKTISLQNRLPVHLTYFTLRVDEDGRIQRFADIYGHDQKVRTALMASSNRLASLR